MTGRQRIGSRYISRRKDGTFSKNVDVGRSLSADRRTKAKKTVKAGYGDKGDVKRAETLVVGRKEYSGKYNDSGDFKIEAGGGGCYNCDGVPEYRLKEDDANSGPIFSCDGCYRNMKNEYGETGSNDDWEGAAESFNAEGDVDDCPECGGDSIQSNRFQRICQKCNNEWKIDRDYGAESFGADEFSAERGCNVCDYTDSQGEPHPFCEKCSNHKGSCCRCVGSSDWEEMQREFPDVPYGADFTTVQRPNHVARVRNDRIDSTALWQDMDDSRLWRKNPPGKRIMPPNLHTEQNKLGKMYDEEKGGWVTMDRDAKNMFEEIGGKISNFDVVGTTQEIVGKTGFNVPKGVASIAILWVAYMTGKKYSN